MTTTPEAREVDPDWYEVANGIYLEQGDLLRACRVPIATQAAPETENAEFDVEVKFVDLIVLTQSCDLAHGKLDTLLLGRVYTWD
jgi:hypothetical protein